MSHWEWCNSLSRSETDNWCSMSMKTGGQTLWHRKCVVIIFAFFYLLTLLRIHNFSIAANAVEETEAETFPTHGIFTQLACTPICSHTSQTDSTVTAEIIPASGGEWWWWVEVSDPTWDSVLMGEAGAVQDAGLWLDQIWAGWVLWWRWESKDSSGPVPRCLVVTRLWNKTR